ncbi:hypothetical protein AWB69_06818 [Caballeronia udeis]|uniref:Uncharacterized protein n=1 Tax=Caballeronia udeis TaxID=1232866 RepID=A0A158IYI7_9BURK|nr:hypothetical protein AWB69_06818 [Caballeronia udeis]
MGWVRSIVRRAEGGHFGTFRSARRLPTILAVALQLAQKSDGGGKALSILAWWNS